MKNISTGKLIGFVIFILVVFGAAFFQLAVIDATVGGWLFFAVLLCALVFFRFSKYWQKLLGGGLAGFNKLWIYLLAVIALQANCVFARLDLKVSYRGTLVREMIRFAKNLPAMKGDGMLAAGAKLSSKGSAWQPPKGYTNTKINCGVPVELLKADNSQSEKLIFEIHGGAYVIGMTDLYRNMAVKYSGMTNGASVLNIDYRIAPEYVFPAALDDALLAWNWILENGWKPENITVIGDSAGGNLALALCLKLRDEGMALPEKIICLSPWADLASTGESHKTNKYNDPMFGVLKNARPQPAKPGEKPMTALYAGETDLFNPYLSPAYGEYHNFPSMLIQVGSWEVLLSDSEMVYEKALAQNVDAKLSVFEGMYHVFQQAGEFMPEGKKAWKEIEEFLNK